MRVCGNRMRMIAGLAASLALAGAVPARAQPTTMPAIEEPIITSPAVLRLKPRDAEDPASAPVHWRSVRVPPGILAGVPTGASPTPPRLRPWLAPFPVGFAADPYYSPPAVACFVPSDFAGQHGYLGSCAESLYQQWMSRPY